LKQFFAIAPLLRERAFALVWLVEVFAISASNISQLALPIIATTMLHATPSQMGLLIACETLPFAMFSLPTGVLVDRVAKVRLLIATFVLLIFSLAVLPAAFWLDLLSMPLVYLVGFAIGTVMTVFGTAHQVLVTHVVGRSRLVDAYRIISTSESMIRLVAPGIAGLLIESLGAPQAVTVEVMVLVFATVLFAQIKEPASSQEMLDDAGPRRSAWHEMVEGLRYCWNDPAMRAMALVAAVWQILFHGFLAMQVLFATRTLGMSAGQIGIANIAGGVGAFAAAMAVKRLNKSIGPASVMVAGLMITTLAWLGFSVLPAGAPWNTVSMGLMLLVFDMGAIAFFINYISMRQIITPDHLLGRVTATMRFASVALAPIGAVATGHVAEWIGLRPTFALLGGIGLVATFALANYKPFRQASHDALSHPPPGQIPQASAS
jgi:Na+/melibiose symporter-like transporter